MLPLRLPFYAIIFATAVNLSGCAAIKNAASLPQGSADDYQKYQDAGHYKAFAITSTKGNRFDRAWAWSVNGLSVADVMNRAIANCNNSAKKYSGAGECRVHSIGDINVYSMTDAERYYAMKEYTSDFDITQEDLDLSKAQP